MKHILFISLFILPLVSMGQPVEGNANTGFGSLKGDLAKAGSKNAVFTDTIAQRLHIATDSFFYYRCRENCAKNAGMQDSVRIYYLLRKAWQEEVHTYYLKYDPNYLDAKKQKKNFRFQNPNKYYKCPCQ